MLDNEEMEEAKATDGFEMRKLDKREPYKRYHVFDLHVNAAFHASVRYSLLFQLHERLFATFGHRLRTVEFPPKSWKNCLDARATNERREGLAKYFQGVLQNPDIAKHSLLEKSFLEFQIASFQPKRISAKLEIFLPDGVAIQLECGSEDPTNEVLRRLGELLGIKEAHLQYFGLFLCKDRDKKEGGSRGGSTLTFDPVCVRWLKNFESPFISQQLANAGASREQENNFSHPTQQHQLRLVVRRVCWDPSVEETLLEDAGCLKILFLQALNDCQRGLNLSSDLRQRLHELHEQGNFKQFLHICHQQADYGYEVLIPVITDYPRPSMCCKIKVGRRQIVLEHCDDNETDKDRQTILRSTRIRVYRVSQTSVASSAAGDSEGDLMSFQMEYLLGKEEFKTITFHTSQAVLLSLFLQSIAAEILRDQVQSSSPTFKFEDGLPTRAIEQLEVSKANSIVSDDLSIKDFGSVLAENGVNGVDGEQAAALWKIISYQMPFAPNETFDEITDADL